MRKAQKQRILEIINTLYEAHKLVKKYIDEKEIANAQAMMAECQNTAVSLSEIISRSEGEDFSVIKAIERYYNLLYNVSQEIDNKSNGGKVKKTLDTEINKIGNSVRNDIKVKLEIIFMPYKASMWDSLESVWKAADEDPNCDAYVVPIPYYDRNPDGSFGEFHYEGGEFPDYIPIVDYKSYSLEKRLPDVIYIHNPYDGNNFVTSVHPNFYSSELKKYTECLAYIPYFVLEEPKSDDENNVKKVSHFITTPVVISADKIIVQSELMKNIYIKCLANQSNRKSDYWNDKILGTGSPKLDKTVNLDKKDYPLPKEWEKIINGRKIVLFNNSIPQILIHEDEFLDKLEQILIVFENRDDYVLWWRPHPLIEQTLTSMRPALFNRYKAIVTSYCNKRFGIYDNTSDLYRAISWSDRYYGAKSSVIWLYGTTGKPVLLFTNNMRKREIFEINNWCTSDIEENDLVDWLDGNEKWTLLKDFKDVFKPEFFSGNIGKTIHYNIKKEIML